MIFQKNLQNKAVIFNSIKCGLGVEAVRLMGSMPYRLTGDTQDKKITDIERREEIISNP